MKQFLWLSVFCLSISWLFGISIYNPINTLLWAAFLTAAILFAFLGLSKSNLPIIHYRYLLLLLFPAVLSIIIGFPYTTGSIVLTIGILIALLTAIKNLHPLLHCVYISCLFTGGILLIQAPLFFVFSRLSLFTHRMDFLTPIISQTANMFGLSTTTNNGLLYLQTAHGMLAFTITWEKIGLFVFSFFLVGALFLTLFFSPKKHYAKHLLILALSAGIYLLLRFVFLLLYYSRTNDLEVFWNPTSITLSFLPLALLYLRILPLRSSSMKVSVFTHWSLDRKRSVAALCVFLGVFLLIGSIGYADPGIEKQGDILIDEYHSDWEDSVRPMDTEWYGLLSTYNYYSWVEWLKAYYSVEHNLDQPLTTELLKDIDIVVLKCPTSQYNAIGPYSFEEIHTILRFVEQGGGLLLIGDHTDVFGMNTFLNLVAEPLGLRLNTDATYELGTGNYTVYTPPNIFSHPTVTHLKNLEFLTSCSLEATQLSALWRIEPAVLGTQLISEPGTYSTENFFRESTASPESTYGYILQCAALKQGQGRVFVFTDSTVFSSFTVFSDGYQSFSLGIFEYLNHKNSPVSPNNLFFFGFLLFFFAGLFLLRKQPLLILCYLIVLSSLFAGIIAVPAFTTLNAVNYHLPEPHRPPSQISFDQTYSNASFVLKPTIPLLQRQDTYDTFYVWTQRLGYVPTYQLPLQLALQKAEIITFINPDQPFDTLTLSELLQYLIQGGHILVIDSINNTYSTANQLLKLGNMTLQSTTFSSENTSTNTTRYLHIQGGTTLYQDARNRTFVSYAYPASGHQNTTGMLLVCVDSQQFKDNSMGGVFTDPTEQQRAVYAVEYLLLRHLQTATHTQQER